MNQKFGIVPIVVKVLNSIKTRIRPSGVKFYSALSENGRLIIEEDVILPEEEWQYDEYIKKQIEQNIESQNFFEEFVNMDRNTQKDILIIIDLLANSLSVGVPDMPFPFGFMTLKEWIDLYKETGYEIEDVIINGFSRDTFNRSSHVFYVLKKAKKTTPGTGYKT